MKKKLLAVSITFLFFFSNLCLAQDPVTKVSDAIYFKEVLGQLSDPKLDAHTREGIINSIAHSLKNNIRYNEAIAELVHTPFSQDYSDLVQSDKQVGLVEEGYGWCHQPFIWCCQPSGSGRSCLMCVKHKSECPSTSFDGIGGGTGETQ